MFFCEYCKTFNNSFFIEHLWWLLLEVTFQNHTTNFWTAALSTNACVCLEFFWTFTYATILKKEATAQFLFQVFHSKKVMFMISNLIEPRLGKLILHLIGNNCPEFRIGPLDNCFFKLTLGSNWLKLCFWRVPFKTILIQ